jgi:hypothetical protein
MDADDIASEEDNSEFEWEYEYDPNETEVRSCINGDSLCLNAMLR